MNTKLRRTFLVATLLVATALTCGGCGCTWLLSDAPKLWQTSKLAGLDTRGQDLNYMMNPSDGGLGGW